MITKNIDQIHRSSDGKFVISYDSDIEIYRPASATVSNSSESDDGGFLPRATKTRTSWRRPLVSYPSEQSFAPITPTARRASFNGLLRIDNDQPPQSLLQTVPIEHHAIPPTYQNINSLGRSSTRNVIFSPQTPSRVSRIISSSPAASSQMANSTILSPQAMYFSDLSSVLQPSTGDRSFPTPQNTNISQLRMLQERYSQELPSLRAIHEETRRMAQNFVPLQLQLHSPSLRYPQNVPYAQIQHTPSQYQMHHDPYHHYHAHHHQQQQQQPLVHQRPKSKLLPRHVRLARSAPELGSPNAGYLNATMHNIVDTSPQSRSSSSGFGSKNTSQTHPNQSSRSESTNEWRYLPPYRPPPQPQYYYYPNTYMQNLDTSTASQHSSPYTIDNWLDLINRLNSSGEPIGQQQKAVDVGSVDGHYEFDPATPTASTPTGGPRDDLLIDNNQQFTTLLHTQSLQPYQRKRVSKYENIEARVQAMKEEFYAYRKRQATQMQQSTNVSTANNNSTFRNNFSESVA